MNMKSRNLIVAAFQFFSRFKIHFFRMLFFCDELVVYALPGQDILAYLLFSYFWFSMKIQTFTPVFFKNIFVVSGAFLGGFYFTSLFHEATSLVGGLWAVISAIIVLEATHKETFTSAKNRLIGTFIGAIVSGVYLYFFTFSILGFIIAVAVGTLICFLFGLQKSVKLTGITISVIMIVATVEKGIHPFLNAGLRFAESAIGTGIAVLVALLALSVENYSKQKNTEK